MGKKLILISLFLLNILGAAALEYGKITYLQGEVFISRNAELIKPILSSRIYLNDTLLTAENGAVRIKTNFNSGLSLKNKTACQINAPSNYKIPYGTAYVKNVLPAQYFITITNNTQEIFSGEFIVTNNTLIEITTTNSALYRWGELSNFSEIFNNTPQTISLQEPLWRTAVFPGWGHLHIDNPAKGWPMLLVTTYLLYNSMNINPANWHSGDMQEQMTNKRTQFQQTYFVFWSWALLDIISETDNYNKKISAEQY